MLKGVVLLAAALTIVNGASVRDESRDCALGPGWWCKNEQNAMTCDATKYCTEHAWDTKVEVPMKCAVCEYVVGAVLKELESESTEAEILKVLEEVCEKIPEVGAQCADYVKVYGPYVIQMLKELVSVDNICEMLKLCSPALDRFNKDNKLIKYLNINNVNIPVDDQCTMCLDGLLEVQDILKDKDMLDVIEASITGFCIIYPLPQCQTLMEQYTKQYIGVIKSWNVKSECTTLGNCKAKGVSVPVVATVSVSVSDDKCDACMDGVKEIKDTLLSKDMRDLLNIAVEDLCKGISIPLCPTLGGELIKLALAQIEKIDPKATCTELGECKAALEPIAVPALAEVAEHRVETAECDACVAGLDELKNMFLANDTQVLIKIAIKEICVVFKISTMECNMITDMVLPELISVVSKLDPKALCVQFGVCPSALGSMTESFSCEYCEFAANQIKKRIDNNETDAQILATAKKFCATLSGMSNECLAIVDEYGYYFLNELRKAIDVKHFCENINLCYPTIKDIVLTVPIQDDGCDACVAGFDNIRTLLTDDDTVQLIKIGVHELCALAESSVCEKILDLLVDNLITDLKALNPKGICQDIGVCPSTREHRVETEECDACVAGLGELKNMFLANDTQVLIKIAIKEICVVFGISTLQCNMIVDMVLPELISVVSKLDPKALCVQFGACPSALGSMPDSFSCEYCEFAANQIKKRIDNNETDAQILATAKKFCATLPNMSDACLTIVDEYGYYFLNELRKAVDVKHFCENINLCYPIKDIVLTVPIQDDSCDACVAGFDDIRTLLTDADTVELLKIGVHELCVYANSSICEEILDLLVDNLITDLKALNPKGICQDIGVCPSTREHRVESVKSVECDACVDGLGELKNILLANDTQAMIQLSIQKMCVLFKIPSATCNVVIDMVLQELVAQVSKLDPKALCVQFGVCPAALGSITESFSCEYCVFVGNQIIKRFFNNETEAFIMGVTKKFCVTLPEMFSNECLALVDEYGYYYLNELRKAIDVERFCEKIKLCDPAIHDIVENLNMIKVLNEYRMGTLECDACVDGVGELKNILLAKDTLALIQMSLQEMCVVFSIPSATCSSVIETVLQELVADVSKIDPKALCVQIGACSAALGSMTESFSCEYCEFVGNQIIKRFFNNETEALILGTTKKFCATLPNRISNECLAIVDKYGHYYLNELRKTLDAEYFCQKIKLCDPAIKDFVLTVPIQDDGCDACVAGFNDIRKLLTDDDTVELIKIGMHELCAFAESTVCEEVLDLVVDNFVTDLKAMDAQEICDAIGACASTRERSEFQKFGLTQSFQCDLCKFIGNETVERLLTYKTITEVLSIAHKGCSYLPFISEECAEFIETDGGDILYKLISYINVDKICSKVKLCAPETLQQDLLSQSFVCDTCEFFGHEFIDRLLTNETRYATLYIAGEACSYIPLYSEECHKFILDDGKYYLDLWISKINTDELCRKLKLCTPEFETWNEASAIIGKDISYCATCLEGFDELKKIMNDQNTKDFNVVAIRQACLTLPIPFCNTMMDKIMNHVTATIEAMDSQVQCDKLGVCPSSQGDKMIVELKPQPAVVNTICDDCVEGINKIKEVLADPDAKIIAKGIVDEVCITLRIPLCKYVLDSFVDSIIDRAAAVDANKTCKMFGFCSEESIISGA